MSSQFNDKFIRQIVASDQNNQMKSWNKNT